MSDFRAKPVSREPFRWDAELVHEPLSVASRAAIAKLYADLPEPAKWEPGRTAVLQEPVDPAPEYPWINRSHFDKLNGDPRAASRFRKAYGFHWRLGPNGENRVECDNCGAQYCAPLGHVCMREEK